MRDEAFCVPFLGGFQLQFRTAKLLANSLNSRVHFAAHNLCEVGAWLSLVGHLLGVQEVAGSNPVAPTIFREDIMAASLAEYEKALVALADALTLHDGYSDPAAKKLARDGCIQRFEFCVELAWKVAGKAMGSNSTAANLVIRELARNEYIDDPEKWFEFVKARNESSHTYDEQVAAKVFMFCRSFLPAGQALLLKLKGK